MTPLTFIHSSSHVRTPQTTGHRHLRRLARAQVVRQHHPVPRRRAVRLSFFWVRFVRYCINKHVHARIMSHKKTIVLNPYPQSHPHPNPQLVVAQPLHLRQRPRRPLLPLGHRAGQRPPGGVFRGQRRGPLLQPRTRAPGGWMVVCVGGRWLWRASTGATHTIPSRPTNNDTPKINK